MKETTIRPSKAHIGSSSRSSTDLTYLHHDMEQRAQPPARREWFSAARPRTEFRCRCSSTASGRPTAMSAACSGVFLTSAVKEQRQLRRHGAGALLCDIAEHSFSEACEARSRALFEVVRGFGEQRPRSAALRTRSVVPPRPSPRPRCPRLHHHPAAPGRKKGTSGGVVPLNRVRTGGGRGASVPRPPGAGVPGWFGPGRRLGPPVALRRGWLVSGRRDSSRRARPE